MPEANQIDILIKTLFDKTGLAELEKGLKQPLDKIKKSQDNIIKSTQTGRKETKRFAFEWLSFMFIGMSISRTFGRIGDAMKESYMKITAGQTTLGKAFTRTQVEFEYLKLAIMEETAPLFEWFETNILQPFLNWFAEDAPGVLRTFAGAIVAVAPPIGTALSAVSQIILAWSSWQVMQSMKAVKNALTATEVAVTASSTTMGSRFGGVMTTIINFLTGPAGIILGIMALTFVVAWAVGLFDNWKSKTEETAEKMWDLADAMKAVGITEEQVNNIKATATRLTQSYRGEIMQTKVSLDDINRIGTEYLSNLFSQTDAGQKWREELNKQAELLALYGPMGYVPPVLTTQTATTDTMEAGWKALQAAQTTNTTNVNVTVDYNIEGSIDPNSPAFQTLLNKTRTDLLRDISNQMNISG